MRTRRIAALAFVAMFTLVGCRDRSTPQDKADELCREMAELDATVTQLAALEPGPNSGARVRELRTQMETRYREVQEASEEVQSLRIDTVTQAYMNVLRSVNGVNDQATHAQAEAQIDTTAGEFSTARLDFHTTARC